jgi:hypothetical protein
MTEPQEPTREIDMAKLLEDQADTGPKPKIEGAPADAPQEAAPRDAAQ